MWHSIKNPNRIYSYLIIWLLSTVISCSCKNPPTSLSKKQSGNTEEIKPTLPHLVLSSNKTTLEEEDLNFQIELKNNIEVEAKLSEYRLKITLQEEGGKGSTLHYRDATNTDHDGPQIDQPVNYFTKQLGLRKGDFGTILPFELHHPADVTEVTITITLEHKGKKVNMLPIFWKNLPSITDKMIEDARQAGYSFLADMLAKLKKGEVVDINSIDTDGWKHTVLHQAVLVGNIAILKALIERGAQLNEKDSVGYTPLYKAVIKDNTEISKLLIEKLDKSQLNEKGYSGDTPLHDAVFQGNVEISKLLIEKLDKSQLNGKNSVGDTPLYDAVSQGNVEISKLLIEKLDKSQLNEKGNSGNTPLHDAIIKAHREIIDAFSDKVADKHNG